MKSLEQFSLATGQKITYQSPVCACLEALEYPHSTPLALGINSLIQAYLNQWAFLLTAYEKLHSIHGQLSLVDDQVNKEPGFTDFDIATTNMEDDIRIHTYVLIISMKSILDFFACLLEATLTATVPEGTKLTDLTKFRKKWLATPSHPLSFMDDGKRFSAIHEIEQLRHRIVHRGYSIRTKFGFKKESDLPILIYQGNDFYSEDGLIYPGDLFAKFQDCMQLWESEAANALQTLQPALQAQPHLSVSISLEGGVTFFNIKELESTLIPPLSPTP